jgi:uncharacterized SAM-binding protein YcdF (DUF218 family)
LQTLWRKKSRAAKAARAVFAAAGAALLAITFTPLVPWIGSRLTVWGETDRGVMIVLGGGTVEQEGLPQGGVAGLNTYWRAVHAVYLWRKSHFRTILLSGAGSEETVKPLLIAYGIPAEVILVENRSVSTHENAVYSQRILATLPGPYALLTSDYHTYRAAACFRRRGIAVTPIPCPDLMKRAQSRMARWQCFWEASIELVRIAGYRLRSWI